MNLTYKNKSTFELKDYHNTLFNNYIRYMLIGKSYINPLIYMSLSLTLCIITVGLAVNSGKIPLIKTFVYSAIIMLTLFQIIVAVKQFVEALNYSSKVFDPKYSELVVYNGIIRGFPLEGRANRVLVNINKPLEEEEGESNSDKNKSTNSPEINPKNQNKVKAKVDSLGRKYLEVPEIAFMHPEYITYIDSAKSEIDAIILELITENKKNYFVYPVKAFFK